MKRTFWLKTELKWPDLRIYAPQAARARAGKTRNLRSAARAEKSISLAKLLNSRVHLGDSYICFHRLPQSSRYSLQLLSVLHHTYIYASPVGQTTSIHQLNTPLEHIIDF